MATQTFAQYLINKKLPDDLKITKPVTGSVVKDVLTQAARKYPGRYDEIVMHIKNLGDRLSTLEGISFGLAEIEVPNKAKRDALLKDYSVRFGKAKTPDEGNLILGELQDKLLVNDTLGGVDDGSLLIESQSANKANQLMKLRTSPAVVKDFRGNIVPRIITKAYSEGLNPLDTWLQSAESRSNLIAGQLSVSEPGVYSKIMASNLNSTVISEKDCGTRDGIILPTKSKDILHRYTAQAVGKYERNTLVTTEVQADLLKQGIKEIKVRSPETCGAASLCSMCDGLDVNGKLPGIGTPTGMMTVGAVSEPLTQLALSSKHSTALAKSGPKGLSGMKGLTTFSESPKIYQDKQVLSEINGEIYKIVAAPQGGHHIQIRETNKVPDRFKENAKKVKEGLYSYYIAPGRRILDGIERGAEVYPGMPLSDGNTAVKDIARLKSIGGARSFFTDGLRAVFGSQGKGLDRRHFERLSRSVIKDVRIEKAPDGLGLSRGDVVNYDSFKSKVHKLNATARPVEECEGLTTTQPYGSVTAGTYITKPIIEQLKRQGNDKIRASQEVETSAVFTPMSRAALGSQNWISNLNHRYIKGSIIDAATKAKKQNIHGYDPIAGYAFGAEFGLKREDGKY